MSRILDTMATVVDFFKRQRRKLFFTGAVIVGGYVAVKLAKWYMASKAAECEAILLDEARLEHHFQSNQRTCDMTVRSLLPSLKRALYERLDVEHLKTQLKSNPGANRVQIWEEMKTTAVSQLIVAMYSSCFLVVFLRLQLNILGGNMYLDSLNEEEDGEGLNKRVDVRVSEGVQREYLNLVHCVLGDGMQTLSRTAKDAVTDVFQSVGLKEHLTVHRMSELLNCVCQKMEGSQTSEEAAASRQSSLIAMILPVELLDVPCSSLSQNEQENLRSLVDATKDLLENDDFQGVFAQCISVGFHHVINALEQHFLAEEGHGSDCSLPLAKILPVVTNTVPAMLEDSGGFLETVMTLPEVQKFAENVYDAFSK